MSPRRGPDLGDIDDDAIPEHRVWLTSLRAAYSESELSFQEIVEKAVCSQGLHVFSKKGGKGKVSELLRGKGRYPRWRPVQAVAKVLAPTELSVYEEQWKEGAKAAGRKPKWISDCLHEVQREPGGTWTAAMKRTAFAGAGVAIALGMVLGALASKHFPADGTEPECRQGMDCSSSQQPTPTPWPHPPYADVSEPPEATAEPATPTPTPTGPYITFPPALITPDMVMVALWESIPVYEKPKQGRPDAFTEPGEEFYLSCRDQDFDFFNVAGSKYWVRWKDMTDFVDPASLYRLKVCSEALAPSPTPTP
ncbi:hypothetical protein ABZZ74_47760 [Streptomyces sp. NPDC006476]|uniref:hypothetical protein n=1 Tax=Streptomyces sp. NPDC006476 TaxID=3157175 RepID=UPI0033BB0097